MNSLFNEDALEMPKKDQGREKVKRLTQAGTEKSDGN